jgi:DMSO/TMAO reductase YedYZ molybdopterin-dependent catalytic subunit
MKERCNLLPYHSPLFITYNMFMKKIIIVIFPMIILASCVLVPARNQATTMTSTSAAPSLQGLDLQNCQPELYAVPTLPSVIPGYTELDPSIGLHITGMYQVVDLETYRLRVTGRVKQPLELTYDQIRCLPNVTTEADIVCPGFFVDAATWKGVPMNVILNLAGVEEDATKVVLVSVDRYRAVLTLDEAQENENFLAYEVNGQILPILHGFPLRAVLPGMDGSSWIKWVVEIQVE